MLLLAILSNKTVKPWTMSDTVNCSFHLTTKIVYFAVIPLLAPRLASHPRIFVSSRNVKHARF